MPVLLPRFPSCTGTPTSSMKPFPSPPSCPPLWAHHSWTQRWLFVPRCPLLFLPKGTFCYPQPTWHGFRHEQAPRQAVPWPEHLMCATWVVWMGTQHAGPYYFCEDSSKAATGTNPGRQPASWASFSLLRGKDSAMGGLHCLGVSFEARRG